MARWQAGLEKKQARLGRLVDIGAELFAIASACTYAQTISAEHRERAAEAIELADLFSKQARHRVEDLFSAVWSNEDDDNHRVALQVLEGRHTWLEDGIVDPAELGS
jgi:hypothetical protein